MLTLQDWVTSSGKYPERAKDPELTDEVKKEADMLLHLVNSLLVDLGITSIKVSSGFRPSSVNSKVPNAAKKSLHMSGKAIDLEDPDNTLDSILASKTDLLDKYGLWLEHPDSTPHWTHLDKGTRTQRKVRIFHP